MAKKPKPSINDQLAALSANREPDVTTLPHDDVSTLQRNRVETSQVTRDNVVPDNVTTAELAGPDGYKRRVRYEKPHASVYAHPKVFKALREIAVARDCKPHDLYLEGLRMVLAAHGRDFDALNRGE